MCLRVRREIPLCALTPARGGKSVGVSRIQMKGNAGGVEMRDGIASINRGASAGFLEFSDPSENTKGLV